MMEYVDPVPPNAPPLDPAVAAYLWNYWDTIKETRIKLHWGPFRPSFKLVVFEPIVEKLLGPRP